LAVLATGNQRDVYVYNFLRNAEQRVQAAWSRWRFNARCTVLGIYFEDEKFGAVIKQSDGVFLDTMDIDPTATDIGATARLTYLDRRMASTDITVDYNSGVANETLWTLPFDIATDDSEGVVTVVQQSNGEVIPTLGTTRPGTSLISTSGSTQDYSAVACWVGVLYDSQYTFSEMHLRDEQGFGDRAGRLTVRDLNVAYQDTMDMVVNVNPLNSCDINYSVASTAPGADGEKYVAVGQLSSDVTLSIKSTGHGPFTALSAWWRGMYTNRAQKV